MTTSYPSQTADRFLVRLPDGMREQIAREAEANNRTMTKEMVLRLQRSFEPIDYTTLPSAVVKAIEAAMAEGDLTQEEALTYLVLAGQSKNGVVLNLHVAPGTTAKDVHTALTAALKLIPPDSNVISAES